MHLSTVVAALPPAPRLFTLVADAGPLTGVSATSGGGALPGTPTIASFASGIGTWALIAAVVGIFVGGLLWAFGSYSQNYQQALNGRRGVLISGVAAVLIGAGPGIINFFFTTGSQAKL